MNKLKRQPKSTNTASNCMRILSFLLATLLLLFCLVSCNKKPETPDEDEPKLTDEEMIESRINNFITYYNDGDMEGVLACLDAKTRNAFQALLDLMGSIAGSAAGFDIDLSDLFSLGVSTASGDFMKLKITDITVISKSKATVKTQMDLVGAGTQEIIFDMVYEKGDWYIHDMTDRKSPDQGNDPDDNPGGTVTTTYEMNSCEPFVDGRAWIEYYEYNEDNYTGAYYGFIDQEGNVLYSIRSGSAETYNIGKGSAIIKSDNKLVLIDKTGDVKMELEGQSEIKHYGGGYAWIYQNKSSISTLEHLYGIVDYRGNWTKALENLQEEGIYNNWKYVGDGFIAETRRYDNEYSIYSGNNNLEILITGVFSDWHIKFSNGMAYIPNSSHANEISIDITKRDESGNVHTETYSNINENCIIYADGRVVTTGAYHWNTFSDGKIVTNKNVENYYQITDYTKPTPVTFEFTAYPVSQIEEFVFNGDYALVQIRGLDKEVYVTMIDIQGNELITPIKGLYLDDTTLAPNGYMYYLKNTVCYIVDKNNNVIVPDINLPLTFDGSGEIGVVTNYHTGDYYIKPNGEKLFEDLTVK